MGGHEVPTRRVGVELALTYPGTSPTPFGGRDGCGLAAAVAAAAPGPAGGGRERRGLGIHGGHAGGDGADFHVDESGLGHDVGQLVRVNVTRLL